MNRIMLMVHSITGNVPKTCIQSFDCKKEKKLNYKRFPQKLSKILSTEAVLR